MNGESFKRDVKTHPDQDEFDKPLSSQHFTCLNDAMYGVQSALGDSLHCLTIMKEVIPRTNITGRDTNWKINVHS